MRSTILEIFKSRDLLIAWTNRNVRARYQQSLIGMLWMVVQPVATVVVFTVIFTRFIPIDTGDIPYVVFSYTALIPWALFSNSITDMANSVVGNMSLVTKVYFPREILPISAMIARLLDALVAGSLLIILILIYDVPFYPLGWAFLPLVLLIQLILMTGLGLFLSAANVFYRDVQPLLALGIQLWFYASPIIYPISMVPEKLKGIYSLNPMVGILEAYRMVLLYQRLPGQEIIIPALISVVIFLVGYVFFKHVEFDFADII